MISRQVPVALVGQFWLFTILHFVIHSLSVFISNMHHRTIRVFSTVGGCIPNKRLGLLKFDDTL